MIPIPTSFLSQSSGDLLAYKHLKGDGPGVILCPGFQSSMEGTKSKALFDWCQTSSREFTCFDYYGHGESEGKSCDGRKQTIGRWKRDLLNVIDTVPTSSKQILVGSSMGGWLMILAAMERRERVSGLVGIAAAPDFTKIFSNQIDECDALSETMKKFGYSDVATEYGGGHYRVYKELLEKNDDLFLLARENSYKYGDFDVPIRLIHGLQDVDISWKYSQGIYDSLVHTDKELILIKDGDHRLASTNHIDIIISTLEGLV